MSARNLKAMVAGMGVLAVVVVGLVVAARRGHTLAVVIAVGLLGAAALGLGLLARLPLWGRLEERGAEAFKDAGIALLTGAVLGLVIYPIDENRLDREQDFEDERADRERAFEETRAVREERRENVRFVREVVTQPDVASKPFASLDLR